GSKPAGAGMAVRGNRKTRSRVVVVPETVHPHYRDAAANIVRHQGVEIVSVPVGVDGLLDADALNRIDQAAALVVQQPNFFGLLENADRLADWAHDHGALLVAVVNPMSLALLKAPGDWGLEGADIACGDGQPFGIPMASGGPSFGFMCARQALVRQMPGRIIGRTEDLDGRCGFTLTLQAREQHIRRGKATSNICTNQGLLVSAATIFLSLLGSRGLHRIAAACHANTGALVTALTELEGVSERFHGPYFHERVIDLPVAAADVVDSMLDSGVLAGLDLGRYYPQMSNSLLLCATEKRTPGDIERFRVGLEACLA
ncbi:MAG: hypothetical protein ACC642_04625, partial [Pseudomonadales bacterium]